jgi:hypothetical protein
VNSGERHRRECCAVSVFKSTQAETEIDFENVVALVVSAGEGSSETIIGAGRYDGMATHIQRTFPRKEVEALLRFKLPETEALSVTRLQNYCNDGVYFESCRRC